MKRKFILVANTGFALYNFRLPLMKFLRDKGGEVIAIANDEADYQARFRQKNIRFISIPIDHKGKNPISDLFITVKLAKIYMKETPDLIHHFTIKPIIFGSLAAKLAQVPGIVNTVTGLGYAFKKGGWLKKLTVILYKVALSGRCIVIFQNRDDFRLFIDRAIVKRTKSHLILGSGINTREIFPSDSARYKHELAFSLVSRMLWSKGIDEFVRAAEIVKNKYPQVKFVMAGGHSGGGANGNPDSAPKWWLQNVNRGGYVKWIGPVPSNEVMALLDKTDVFVLPSYYPEGVPRSLIEAAAKGKAIITTDTPGCREVVEDMVNGFLVPPNDVDALADRMLEFIERPELVESMGKASRTRAEELFDERKVLEKIVMVYKEARINVG